MKDLVLLVPDIDIEETLKGLLLSRYQSLAISEITFDIFRHPNRDPGCWNEAEKFLQPLQDQYRYAMVCFDYEGCGQEDKSPETLQNLLEKRLAANGWADRNRVIILQPEIEIWVWSDSSEVDACLGWANKSPNLRDWLQAQNLLLPGAIKPYEPKKAMELALRQVRKVRSSVLYRQLAERVSLKRCTDPAFQRFINTMKTWFGNQ